MRIVGTVIIPGEGRPLGDVTHPLGFAAPEQFKLQKAMRHQIKGMGGEMRFQGGCAGLQVTRMGRHQPIKQGSFTGCQVTEGADIGYQAIDDGVILCRTAGVQDPSLDDSWQPKIWIRLHGGIQMSHGIGAPGDE